MYFILLQLLNCSYLNPQVLLFFPPSSPPHWEGGGGSGCVVLSCWLGLNHDTWVGLPKVAVRLPVPGDASSLQKSKSSNVQGLLGSLSVFGLTPSVVFLLLCFWCFNCLGSQKPQELMDLNSKINNEHSNNIVVLKTLPSSLTESRVWKCLGVSYAIA